MTVFANGLEIACKAQSNRVIAAFPDVCFTPPENPATPPGVPIPYPSFGVDGDTDKGTATVKIGGGTVTQKDLSYLTKTSGTEAGCAAKKGLISSQNTGKEYAVAWSSDVKMDGEPVSRFSDLSTNNHTSKINNGAMNVKVSSANYGANICEKLNIKPYDQLKCPKGYQKEHTVEVQFFTASGCRGLTLKCWEAYDEQKAPCICMKASWIRGERGKVKSRTHKRRSGRGRERHEGPVVGKTKYTQHYYKSARAEKWIQDNPSGKMGDFMDHCVDATLKELKSPRITNSNRDAALKCLKDANENYITESTGKSKSEARKQNRCRGTCKRARADGQRVANAKAAKSAAMGIPLNKVKVTVDDVNAHSAKPSVGCS